MQVAAAVAVLLQEELLQAVAVLAQLVGIPMVHLELADLAAAGAVVHRQTGDQIPEVAAVEELLLFPIKLLANEVPADQ